MKKLLLILALVLSANAWAELDSSSKEVSCDLVKVKEGLLFEVKFCNVTEGQSCDRKVFLSETPFTGICTSYYDNGQLQRKGNFKNGRQDGLLELFHANGQPQRISYFKEGKAHGPFKEFYENGLLQGEGNFKEGMREGLWEGFWPNGYIARVRNYHEDEWHGMYIDYNSEVEGSFYERTCFLYGKEASARELNSCELRTKSRASRAKRNSKP